MVLGVASFLLGNDMDQLVIAPLEAMARMVSISGYIKIITYCT